MVLVRTRKPGARPDDVVWPTQYQADDSASGVPTSALGVGVAADGAGESGGRGDADAGEHERHHEEDAPPSLRAVVGGTHSSPLPPPGAGRRAPTPARERAGQHDPGDHLERHRQRDVGEAGERERGRAGWTAYWAAHPKAGRRGRGCPPTVRVKLPAGA